MCWRIGRGRRGGGRFRDNGTKLNDKPENPSISLPAPEFNAWQRLIVIAQYPTGDERAKLENGSKASPGDYEVTFILGVPGKNTFHSNLDIANFLASGDSLIAPANGEGIRVQLSTHKDNKSIADFLIQTNEAGRLARVLIRMNGQGFRAVSEQANDIAASILSWLSYSHDAAIDVAATVIREVATGSFAIEARVLGQVKQLLLPLQGTMQTRFRTLLSAYREALGGTNVFHQFLCYFKVIEGITAIRAAMRKTQLANGQTPRDISERIPELVAGDIFLQSSFRPFLGQKYTFVRDRLRNKIRNALAHLDPTAEVIIADRFSDFADCEGALPVIKFIAREMLRNEILADPEMANSKIL